MVNAINVNIYIMFFNQWSTVQKRQNKKDKTGRWMNIGGIMRMNDVIWSKVNDV